MTLTEALIRSRQTGEHFYRVRPLEGQNNWHGWIAYDEAHTYKLSVSDLLGQWEPAAAAIPKITGGRWHAAEPAEE